MEIAVDRLRMLRPDDGVILVSSHLPHELPTATPTSSPSVIRYLQVERVEILKVGVLLGGCRLGMVTRICKPECCIGEDETDGT